MARRELETRHPHAPAAIAATVVLIVTAALAIVVSRVNDRNEDRLLRQQLRQAGSALTVANGSIQLPLLITLQGSTVTANRSVAFTQLMSSSVGNGRLFTSAALWRIGSSQPITVLGKRPGLLSLPAADIQRFLTAAAANSPRFSVMALPHASPPRLGYAIGSTPIGAVVYAETALPENRTAVPARTDPYRGVDYAIYLGRSPTMSHLIAASSRHLPLTGRHASLSVPFGTTRLLIIFAPRSDLGGWLLANLWWLIAIGGVLLAVGVAIVADRLSRQQRAAARLARLNEDLYAEQRGIALSLQESLLPRLPDVEHGVEIAATYRPAAAHTEVGGDWYDVIVRDDGSLVLVVGDVAGHGLESAATMAELRFAARAYANEGHEPAAILTKMGALVKTREAGFFATVLCLTFRHQDRSIVLANAGHPRPLLVDADGSRFIDVPPQPPIGIPVASYSETRMSLPERGLLLAFTDGLIERRDEMIDAGMERLRRAAVGATGPLDELLHGIIESVSVSSHTDDIVILGLRWHDANRTHPGRATP